MRVIFLGTPEFAVPSLKALLESGYDIAAVFTQPDRPSGRGQALRPSPVKVFSTNNDIPVHQPVKIRLEENRPIFERLEPDFVVVVAYGQILPGWLLQSARIAPVNAHGSLLPKYRGAAPLAWSVLNGDSVTGVTTMWMAEQLDAGPILLKREFPLPSTMSTGELTACLAEIGAELLVQTLGALEHKTMTPVPQDEAQVTWAPRITKEMSRVSWARPAREIHNQIRGLNPWPGAVAEFRGQQLRLWRGRPLESGVSVRSNPGVLLDISESGLIVQCGESTALEVLEVQMPGKNRVSARSFVNGARLSPGQSAFC
jgi:methionyl-tRNA formyltransferase